MDTPEQTLRGYQARIERVLTTALPPASAVPAHLHAAMRYATLGGGKRVRACLVYAAAEALSAPGSSADAPACAIELIHAYSLAHDDLPCMDDDDLRRGRPTCHRAFDEPTALLAGDALQTLAFHLLAEAPGVAPDRRLEMIALLARASGSAGMAGGQAIDLAAVGKALTPAQLEDMHRRKTGALIHASVLLGALCAPDATPEKLTKLDTYGQALGLAFQIVDDILDVEGDTAILGKTRGADQARNKPTYPAIWGLAQAKAKAAELRTTALASLGGFGDNGAMLAYMADYIISRTH